MAKWWGGGPARRRAGGPVAMNEGCRIERTFCGQAGTGRWTGAVPAVDERPARVDERASDVDGSEPSVEAPDYNMLRCDRVSHHYILWFGP
jgi:hypothetical protein